MLGLTAEGTQFVAELMAARRRIINGVISRMGPHGQRNLAQGGEAFMAAAEAAPAAEAIGLPDGRIIS